jgi:hypothetical protein
MAMLTYPEYVCAALDDDCPLADLLGQDQLFLTLEVQAAAARYPRTSGRRLFRPTASAEHAAGGYHHCAAVRTLLLPPVVCMRSGVAMTCGVSRRAAADVRVRSGAGRCSSPSPAH